MTYAVTLVGPMSATFNDDGSVVLRTEGDLVGPKWALRHMGAATNDPPHSDEDIRKATKPRADRMRRENREHRNAFKARRDAVLGPGNHDSKGILPEGRTLLTHVSKIRLAG